MGNCCQRIHRQARAFLIKVGRNCRRVPVTGVRSVELPPAAPLSFSLEISFLRESEPVRFSFIAEQAGEKAFPDSVRVPHAERITTGGIGRTRRGRWTTWR